METNERKQSQNNMIVEYMNKFTWITPLEAIRDLGCYRLASRISDLRKKGYLIVDEFIEVPTRMGGTTRVKRYRLAGEEDWQT